MPPALKPTELLSINEDGVFAKVVLDEREPFGSRTIWFNHKGLKTLPHLIEEYGCNAITLTYDKSDTTETENLFAPALENVRAPKSILGMTIYTPDGAFHPKFDFKLFERFGNVKYFSVWNISMGGKLEGLFPEMEVLRIFAWKKNKVKYQTGLWPNLRCLQIPDFKGDLSLFSGWNIRSLFVDSANLADSSSIRAFPELETLKADNLSSEFDLSALSDLSRLKHLSMRKPRRPPITTGFTSQSLEWMILEKIDHLDVQSGFPNLKFFGIDLGKGKRLDQWSGFEAYGDPFSSPHFIRPLPPQNH